MRSLPIQASALQADLTLILTEAKLPTDLLSVTVAPSHLNTVRFECHKKPWTLKVTATAEEQSATFYRGLRGLGFLFPHPRTQISPTEKQIKARCGQTYVWKPMLKHRGLHLHTLHPNEWVRGFFMDRPDVAESIVRWSARNTYNTLDVSLLREPLEDLAKKFNPAFKIARELGVHTGVSLGVALQQQNSYKLITLWQAFTGLGAEEAIERELTRLIKALDTSFIVLEAGTSEFTGTGPENTIQWLNQAARITRENGRALFTKVHVSSNQHDKKYGNYNFLPSFADSWVGIMPHTVMFYSLNDDPAPMYGNKNFHGIRDFTLREVSKRPTWYYPETGYWVAMDQDIPLLLTDYLRSRAEDLRWLVTNKVTGQLIFSTGHGFGGWLYDWTQALLIDGEFQFDPYIGLKLLGEDVDAWKKMFDYQAHHFKNQGVIAMLSSANLQDELSSTHRIHDRKTMRELNSDGTARQNEIQKLRMAAVAWPEIKVKDAELERLLLITRLRLEQALQLREAMNHDGERGEALQNSRALRAQATLLLQKSRTDHRNYADIGMLDVWANPTSYQFGYLYPAASLYFWEREERMVNTESFWPFASNIYDVWDILF